jgi:DNA polymerase V
MGMPPDSDQLSQVSVHAGFPNPATDSDRTSHGLSLDQLLLGRPSSTYLFRLSGHGWAREGVADGDIAVVDRALGVRPNDLVVAWQGDEFMLIRAHRLPADIAPWGVVSAIIHHYRRED